LVLAQDFGVPQGRATIETFKALLPVVDAHYRWCETVHGLKRNDLGAEVRKRVRQLTRLLEMIVGLLEQIAASHEVVTPPADGGETSNRDETLAAWEQREETRNARKAILSAEADIEILTESFYWLAWRTKQTANRLVGVGSFAAEGIRNVRNLLLEHPEHQGKSPVHINSFGYGAPQGPVVKAVRYAEQEDVAPDAGLFVNATEFATKLSEAIKRAMAADQERD
jgi:hypothetical protein